jgi:hypothetical protein
MSPLRWCPLCEEPLARVSGLWLCGWCGFRLGLAEPRVTHEEVAEATARFLAAGGVITRLPDGPEPDPAEVRLREEITLGLLPRSWDEVG